MYIPGKHLLELIDIEEEIQGLDGENVVPALLPVSLEHSMGSCYHMLTHTVRWTCVGHVTGHVIILVLVCSAYRQEVAFPCSLIGSESSLKSFFFFLQFQQLRNKERGRRERQREIERRKREK